MSGKRYPELSPETRTFLEVTLTTQRIVYLAEIIALYETKPHVFEFLDQAHPATLDWLKGAREEEIAQLREAIGLVAASRTVGRFVKWAVLIAVSTFMGVVALVKAINEFSSLWKVK